MTNKLYSVRIGNGRWISWCGFDECEHERWYETCDYDNRAFTYEQALKIVEQLKAYYIYKCWICSDEGDELHTAQPQVCDVPDDCDMILF